MTQISTRLVAWLATAALLSSCSLLAPRPDPSRFYVLTTAEATDAGDGTPLPGLSLGLGPISLPDYVQRQEVVIRTGTTEVQPSQVDRWAGALESNVKRVVAENLSRFVGTDRLWVYPSYEITRADYMIGISVVRFDLDTQNNAFLNARWEVQDNKTKRSVSRGTRVNYPATSPDISAGVQALSRTLADLSRDIAAAVRDLDKKRELDTKR